MDESSETVLKKINFTREKSGDHLNRVNSKGDLVSDHNAVVWVEVFGCTVRVCQNIEHLPEDKGM